jgi:cytidylate kinase
MNGSGVKRVVVAIDGPAGAGKSTVAQRLARSLGYVLLDTGAIYRTVALAAVRAGVSLDDDAAVAEVAERLAATGALKLEPAPELGGKGIRVRLDGEDVSSAIRTPDVSLAASRVSSIPAVRTALLELQRAIGADGGVVAEGRDIGTVVFPAAAVKIFLTASVEIRARRRHEELRASGQEIDFEQVREEVELRDQRDSQRAVAPLRQAADAVYVDSTGRDVDELVAELGALVARALG